MRATPSWSISCTKSGKAIQLHPENAETGGLYGRVERGRNTEAERHAGIQRVDDAVIPQPRRCIVRVPLLLILGADRRLEALFLLGRPVLPARRKAVAANRRQH